MKERTEQTCPVTVSGNSRERRGRGARAGVETEGDT